MNKLTLVMLLSFCLGYTASANAVDCSPLAPTPPQDISVSVTAKFEAAIRGAFSNLVGGKTDVEGTYQKVAKDVLPQFPDGSKLYMWDRVVFLHCEMLNRSPGITAEEQARIVRLLYADFDKKPPEITTTTGQNLRNESGSCSNVVQGSGNTVSGITSNCK
jgi:hypothetical protein